MVCLAIYHCCAVVDHRQDQCLAAQEELVEAQIDLKHRYPKELMEKREQQAVQTVKRQMQSCRMTNWCQILDVVYGADGLVGVVQAVKLVQMDVAELVEHVVAVDGADVDVELGVKVVGAYLLAVVLQS